MKMNEETFIELWNSGGKMKESKCYFCTRGFNKYAPVYDFFDGHWFCSKGCIDAYKNSAQYQFGQLRVLVIELWELLLYSLRPDVFMEKLRGFNHRIASVHDSREALDLWVYLDGETARGCYEVDTCSGRIKSFVVKDSKFIVKNNEKEKVEKVVNPDRICVLNAETGQRWGRYKGDLK